jgi:MFS family permease
MMTYRREETGRRMSYIFMCAALAGAVGGLISGGLVTIETGSIVGWQYLYIVSHHYSKAGTDADMQVEGIISLVLSPIAYFWIPNRMEQAWFLNETQKEQARTRYQMNIRNYNEEEKFNWAEVKRALVHWPVRRPSPVELLNTDN